MAENSQATNDPVQEVILQTKFSNILKELQANYQSATQITLAWRFFTSNLNLSVVRHMPWKFVRTFLPWMSSEISLNFLKAASSSWRSAWDTSNTRPFNPSLANSEVIKYQPLKSLRNKTLHLTFALRSSDKSFPNLSIGEHHWSLYIVPVLFCKRINSVE